MTCTFRQNPENLYLGLFGGEEPFARILENFRSPEVTTSDGIDEMKRSMVKHLLILSIYIQAKIGIRGFSG